MPANQNYPIPQEDVFFRGFQDDLTDVTAGETLRPRFSVTFDKSTAVESEVAFDARLVGRLTNLDRGEQLTVGDVSEQAVVSGPQDFHVVRSTAEITIPPDWGTPFNAAEELAVYVPSSPYSDSDGVLASRRQEYEAGTVPDLEYITGGLSRTEVEAGGTFDATVTVQNNAGPREVTFDGSVGGETVNDFRFRKTVQLQEGRNTVTIEMDMISIPTGTQTVAFSVGDIFFTVGEIEVVEAVEHGYEVDCALSANTVPVGDTVTATATVTNPGFRPGEGLVEWEINGSKESEARIRYIDADGGSQSRSIEVEGVSVGEIDVAVMFTPYDDFGPVEDGGVIRSSCGSVEVVETPEPPDDRDGSDDQDDGSDDQNDGTTTPDVTPECGLSDVTITEGETVSVPVSLTAGSGDTAVTATVRVDVAGVSAAETVELPPNGSATVEPTFEITEPGDYTPEVTIE